MMKIFTRIKFMSSIVRALWEIVLRFDLVYSHLLEALYQVLFFIKSKIVLNINVYLVFIYLIHPYKFIKLND